MTPGGEHAAPTILAEQPLARLRRRAAERSDPAHGEGEVRSEKRARGERRARLVACTSRCEAGRRVEEKETGTAAAQRATLTFQNKCLNGWHSRAGGLPPPPPHDTQIDRRHNLGGRGVTGGVPCA